MGDQTQDFDDPLFPRAAETPTVDVPVPKITERASYDGSRSGSGADTGLAESPGAADQPRAAAGIKWLSSFRWPVTSIPHYGKIS